MASPKVNVLVTGANGYIGNAVAHAFVRAGYRTYGLVRDPNICSCLASSEIVPLLGSSSDTSFLPSLKAQGIVFGIIVSTTSPDAASDYVPHYNDTISLFRTLATASNAARIRPLVLFTSGCKDYGAGPLANTPGLEPQTELSPLNPQPSLVDRANCSIKTFENNDLFDTVVTRPTHAAKKVGEWVVEEDGMTILHALHVDDCADAYVALAECERGVVAGQCYNISSRRFETLDEILNALVKEYGIEGGVRYVKREGPPGPKAKLLGFSQWVGSEKLRRDTGWTDKRLLFSEGVKQYRVAYEAAVERGDERLAKLMKKVAGRHPGQK
ncbi:NAD(P)-binding protein [Mollisia scopiformis]|uniref:NAD(P)-binding protein n=1 Tax=Mollisia scopiformis TaxID=149040 RepID=A0A194X4A6_MOLSC|nr:NAD(P)-binding protein [Mollisia scopiformis]KUJ14889.1 NAD(P)-binding protein [Mollisia scopiformis]